MPGYKDADTLNGELKTNSQVMPQEMFNIIDINSVGTLTIQELQAAVDGLGFNESFEKEVRRERPEREIKYLCED